MNLWEMAWNGAKSQEVRWFGVGSGFSPILKIDNVAINANFPYMCNFLHYFKHIIFVNVKLDATRYKRVIFQGCRLHWSGSSLKTQLKQSLQKWHLCNMVSFWKTLVELQLQHLWSQKNGGGEDWSLSHYTRWMKSTEFCLIEEIVQWWPMGKYILKNK